MLKEHEKKLLDEVLPFIIVHITNGDNHYDAVLKGLIDSNKRIHYIMLDKINANVLAVLNGKE